MRHRNLRKLSKKKESVLELIKGEMPYVNEPNNSFYGSGR
jgi:hypothetical protein